jgi:hypothetical protein
LYRHGKRWEKTTSKQIFRRGYEHPVRLYFRPQAAGPARSKVRATLNCMIVSDENISRWVWRLTRKERGKEKSGRTYVWKDPKPLIYSKCLRLRISSDAKVAFCFKGYVLADSCMRLLPAVAPPFNGQ